ncbi:MAG: Ig-like domain-containing protein, partial [Firmicutes bacterium]|nr:Ig-like domain-containing protein [Bacillota bacterium]
MNKMRKLLSVLTIIALVVTTAFALVGCRADNGSYNYVPDDTINIHTVPLGIALSENPTQEQSRLTLNIGDTETLILSNAAFHNHGDVVWSVNNASIATVERQPLTFFRNARVSAISYGRAVVTATVNNAVNTAVMAVLSIEIVVRLPAVPPPPPPPPPP